MTKFCKKCDHLKGDYCKLYSTTVIAEEGLSYVRCSDCLSHKTFILADENKE